MLPVIGWFIYYGDGSIVNSVECAWNDAPSGDVQIVELIHEAPYRTLVHGIDHYQISPTDDIKFGRWADLDWYMALLEKVVGSAWRAPTT